MAYQNNSQLAKRTIGYSIRVINLYRAMERDGVGRVIGKQILRSGTSIGANVHEAQGAQSKADFIAKISIAQKEAIESQYWLQLIQEAELVPANRLQDLHDETQQIIKIISAILLTAKRKSRKDQPPEPE